MTETREYERIYFDELTTFTQKQYLFLARLVGMEERIDKLAYPAELRRDLLALIAEVKR